MSEENAEVVRSVYESFNRGDWEAMIRLAHPEFEATLARGPNEGTHRGRDSIRAILQDQRSAFDAWTIEVEQVFASGDQVLAVVRSRLRPKGTDAEFETRNGMLWTGEDGLLLSLRGFPNPDDALEAAGFSDCAMSEENAEILRRGFESFNRTGELDLELFATDAVWDNSQGIIDPGVYRGREGIGEYVVALGEIWNSQRVEPEELIPVDDDRVIIPQKIISTGRDGIEVVARTTSIFTLRDGKVVHIKTFQTKDEALEAGGLSD